MSNIVIGKFTLESLTNGMYASPMDLYREYVQNAVDSIDVAVNGNVLTKRDAEIKISVMPEERKLSVFDNGIGIPVDKAAKVLLDIGNSEKDRSSNRGFRGIGRLAGLGYCDRLRFTTSSAGEKKKTQIEFNAKLLRDKLRGKGTVGESIFDVLDAVTNVKILEEKENKHYFLVELEGVEKEAYLINKELVREYLVQNLPLPYNPKLHWGRVIEKKIQREGYDIPSYRIVFKFEDSEELLYKCYENSFVSDRVKKYVKSIEDVDIVPFMLRDKLTAVLWVAKLEYAGTILDEYVKGIRIRQGNLLIGNKNTANQYFKEDRFNGWLLGELFIVNDDLIPNARRDDFEETSEYLELKQQLLIWSTGISKEIRKLSYERCAIAEKKNVIQKVLNDSDENGLTIEDIGFADEDFELNCSMDETSFVADNELFNRFQILLGQKGNDYKYRVLNLRDDIPHEQRKMLEKVFDILYETYAKRKAESISEDIIKNY